MKSTLLCSYVLYVYLTNYTFQRFSALSAIRHDRVEEYVSDSLIEFESRLITLDRLQSITEDGRNMEGAGSRHGPVTFTEMGLPKEEPE